MKKRVFVDTRITGHIAEMKVVQKLLELGYPVLSPVMPQDRTDYWIRCEGEKYIKLQVKNARLHKYSKTFNIASRGERKQCSRPYTKDQVDFFIAVYGSSFYVVPFDMAYGGVSQKRFILAKSFLEAWNLLPSPFSAKPIEAVEVKSRQEMLFVA